MIYLSVIAYSFSVYETRWYIRRKKNLILAVYLAACYIFLKVKREHVKATCKNV